MRTIRGKRLKIRNIHKIFHFEIQSYHRAVLRSLYTHGEREREKDTYAQKLCVTRSDLWNYFLRLHLKMRWGVTYIPSVNLQHHAQQINWVICNYAMIANSFFFIFSGAILLFFHFVFVYFFFHLSFDFIACCSLLFLLLTLLLFVLRILAVCPHFNYCRHVTSWYDVIQCSSSMA